MRFLRNSSVAALPFVWLLVSGPQPQIEAVAGVWTVLPTPPATTWRFGAPQSVWPDGRIFENGRDVQVYSTNAAFPASLTPVVASGQLRDWKIADVTLPLAQFNPVTGALQRLTAGLLVVQFSTAAPRQRLGGEYADTGSAEHAKKLVANFDQMAPEYRTSRTFVSHKPVYLIVTTRQIEADSAALKRFTQSKKKRGFDVNVVTEEKWGGGRGDAAAEKLRAWLQAEYLSSKQVLDRHNLSWEDVPKYLLLIGNPDPTLGDVPMKMLYPRPYPSYYLYDRDTPSDFYYSDLTGNWDLNGDHMYGGYPYDFGTGGIDRYPELLVGRIPYYGNIADTDTILDKIVRYENESPTEAAWRNKVLLPMKPSDEWTPGYQLGEEIKNRILIPSGLGYSRIYDSTYGLYPPPETWPVTVANVTQVWTASPFGANLWWTHGWSEGAADVMDLPHAMTLNDAYPTFTFQASCDNSYPEDASNLSYMLLKKGGLNTIGATRLSWYWIGQRYFTGSDSNSGFTIEYARRLIADRMDSGAALSDLRAKLNPSCAEMWMNYTGFNLFGDPSIGLFTAEGK